MMYRLIALALLTSACGGGTPKIECGPGTSGSLTPGGTLAVTTDDAKDLFGSSVSAHSSALQTGDVSIECAADIAPTGYEPVGPAVDFNGGFWRELRNFSFLLPYEEGLLPDEATRHIQVAYQGPEQSTPAIVPVANLQASTDRLMAFNNGGLGTYQLVIHPESTEARDRRFAYRALVGVSMGGDAALSLGMRNPDEFDFVATLGGEPGPAKQYALQTLFDYTFGGFCTVQDELLGNGDVGQLCIGQQRPLRQDQNELGSDFEHFVYQDGLGVGLTLTRDLYIRASRDMSRAYGNPTVYNPDNSYLPPDFADGYEFWTRADQCQTTQVLTGFYDYKFNPDGLLPVISTCGGGDAPGARGVFDPNVPQTNPWQILLSVDVNENGVRDQGEPVIVQPSEPWSDVGVDGLSDPDETGPLGAYDPVGNPDPAGDNFHYSLNPAGTENNLQYDEGEPYDDLGLDGVACPNSPCIYDYGEGDGMFNLSPNIANWYSYGIEHMNDAMSPSQRKDINLWFDAGIRDFFNAHVSVNTGVGYLHTEDRNVRMHEAFVNLTDENSENLYDFAEVNWDKLPTDVYVRYGDPDATQTEIDNGDGRHVGTALQLIHRVSTAFAWISHHWPGGDRDPNGAQGQIIEELIFTSPSTGRATPYGLFLPPGYDDPANADKRYPLIIFLHGYGQQPSDLVAISSIFENFMINAEWREEQRFQKFIILYFDGLCRPRTNEVPVDPDGDQCERGTFYLDSPSSPKAQLETILFELLDHMDQTYRTKKPQTVTWQP